MFLAPPKPPKSTRQRRGARMGLAALAVVGFSLGDLQSVVPIHVVYVLFLDIAKINQKQMQKLYVA